MTTAVRQARPDDGRALRQIERLAGVRFREVGRPEVADDEPAPVEVLTRYADDGRSWVAIDEQDVPIGYVLVESSTGARTSSS